MYPSPAIWPILLQKHMAPVTPAPPPSQHGSGSRPASASRASWHKPGGNGGDTGGEISGGGGDGEGGGGDGSGGDGGGEGGAEGGGQATLVPLIPHTGTMPVPTPPGSYRGR